MTLPPILRGPWLPLLLLVAVLLFWWRQPTPSPPKGPTYADFSVETADGPLALSDLSDRAVLLYFGYTACPDFCPTTLATAQAAWHMLSDETRAHAAVLFVSVDPDRDSPERLQRYVRHFSPSFLAGTRPEPEIRRIAADWGVRFRKADLGGSAMGYAVDHTTDAYLVSPDRSTVEALPHGTEARAIADRWTAIALGH